MLPFVLLIAYILQKFYLRTSRQIRLLDLEAKSPLYTHFTETLQGLSVVRAFGWQTDFQERLEQKLDTSQTPYYLLFCIQRWLTLVSDLIVAGIAIILVALATQISSGRSGGSVGLALLNVLSFSESLTTLIQAYTNMETSIAAISRVKQLEQTCEREDILEGASSPPSSWPAQGSITCQNLSASYRYVSPRILLILDEH